MVGSQYFLFIILITCSTIHCREQRNERNERNERNGRNERNRGSNQRSGVVWRENWRAIYCQANPSAALVAAFGNCFNQRPASVCSILFLKIL
jgi:hypothetical protein